MPSPADRPAYPDAERLALVEDLHGHQVADPYRWLEDRDDPRTAAWSQAQAQLCEHVLGASPLRDRFHARVGDLLASGSVSPPAVRGARRFWLRREPGQDHAVLLVRDGDGAERALVDVNALDPAGTTTLDAWQPSVDGDLLAYQLSVGGDEESALHVLDVATGDAVEGPIDRTRYSPVAWLPDGRRYYYVRRLPPEAVPQGEEQYHRRVWLHEVGTDPAADVEVFGAGRDKTDYFDVRASRDGRWLLVSAAQGTAPRDDVWIADLDRSGPDRPDLVEVQVGVDARLDGVVREGALWIQTDRDAPRGRLVVTDPRRPGVDDWRTVLEEDAEAVLDSWVLCRDDDGRDLVVAAWTRHAVAGLTVHEAASGRLVHRVDMPGLGTLTGLTARPDAGPYAWIGYVDHVRPPSVHRLDVRTGEVVREEGAPGQVQVPEVVVGQVRYRSADDTVVRMFVLSPTGAPDEPRPTILYGYGGFDVSLTPDWSPAALAWVEAGGVYAVANLRGGSEEGQEWHRAGMREHKTNVFDDFRAAAEWLLANGWTSRRQLAVQGGSNGGLLVGAAVTRFPDLLEAAVCSAPLLDMVRYESFGLGATWNDEYGSAEVPGELEWLLGYSPYHHVREGVDYPAVLFTVFDSDTRVDPLHARKMCAALQHATAGSRPVVLRAERDVGHGARSISRAAALAADQLGFLAARLGLRPHDGAVRGSRP